MKPNLFALYHGHPMSDEMFQRPASRPRVDDENSSPATTEADKTLKNPAVPSSPQWGELTQKSAKVPSPAWEDAPAVSLYETPYEKKTPIYVSRPVTAPRAGSPPPPPHIARESAARQRIRKRQARSNNADWAWVIVAGAILGIVFLVGMSAVLLLQGADQEKPFVPTATLDVAALPAAVDLREQGPVNPQDAETGDIILLSDGTPIELKPWDGTSRFTILAMGIDRRPDDESYAHLTDTMMLISIDPTTNRIGILSIPRDLYVPVPGYSANHRINTAMVLGEVRSPGSGSTLAMQTVQNNLGMAVNEYVLVDFQAVIDLVDAIGGITITTDYTINDPNYPDMYYGYDPFYLPAGTNQLDGINALKFARTRHGDNDLERARRQQEVIYAIRDKVLDFDLLPTLIVQAPTLLASLDDNVKTGLSLTEMIELAWFVKSVPRENITTGVIDYQYVQNYTTDQGEAVLLPVRSRLASLLIAVFGENYAQ